MAEFLEGYGVADARRARIFWRLVIAGAVVAALGLTLYFVFRTWPAKRQVNQFVELLRKKDYQGAYRLWGCAAPDSPCRDYTFEKFLEDWGPKGPYADAAGAQVKSIPARTCHPDFWETLKNLAAHAVGERGCDCGPGVIHALSFPNGEEVRLRYERKDSTLGTAPWPVCKAQPKAYE